MRRYAFSRLGEERKGLILLGPLSLPIILLSLLFLGLATLLVAVGQVVEAAANVVVEIGGCLQETFAKVGHAYHSAIIRYWVRDDGGTLMDLALRDTGKTVGDVWDKYMVPCVWEEFVDSTGLPPSAVLAAVILGRRRRHRPREIYPWEQRDD